MVCFSSASATPYSASTSSMSIRVPGCSRAALTYARGKNSLTSVCATSLCISLCESVPLMRLWPRCNGPHLSRPRLSLEQACVLYQTAHLTRSRTRLLWPKGPAWTIPNGFGASTTKCFSTVLGDPYECHMNWFRTAKMYTLTQSCTNV